MLHAHFFNILASLCSLGVCFSITISEPCHHAIARRYEPAHAILKLVLLGLAATKPVFRVCKQQRHRPACASKQTHPHLCYSRFTDCSQAVLPLWIICVFVSCVSHAFASIHCCLVVTCWERANLFALVCDVYCIILTFPCGILCQACYLIV